MTKERGTAGRSSNASFGSSRIGIRTNRHSSACAVAAGGRGSSRRREAFRTPFKDFVH